MHFKTLSLLCAYAEYLSSAQPVAHLYSLQSFNACRTLTGSHTHYLLFGNWNILTLARKELELVKEVQWYHLNTVEVFLTKRCGFETADLGGGWKLFYSGADPSMSAQVGEGIITSPRLSDCVSNWIPSGSRVYMLKLLAVDRSLCLWQVYVPNATIEYRVFVDEVPDALLCVSPIEPIVLMGGFNAHVGTDTDTWKDVIWKIHSHWTQ